MIMIHAKILREGAYDTTVCVLATTGWGWWSVLFGVQKLTQILCKVRVATLTGININAWEFTFVVIVLTD